MRVWDYEIRINIHRFLQLVAHEFFHLWNIKRIRPKALESFDYDAENYTSSLWFAEGTSQLLRYDNPSTGGNIRS
jgi:predicted metalloprotease with PDZ domain